MRRVPALFPRPIVGRSNPEATWLVDLAEVAAAEGRPKRTDISGLFAYPRVGRMVPDARAEETLRGLEGKRERSVGLPVGRFHQGSGAEKRSGREDPQLWFGPRLGKRMADNQPPWALITLREYPPNGRHNKMDAFTPRLGRESSEETEDYDSRRLHAERL